MTQSVKPPRPGDAERGAPAPSTPAHDSPERGNRERLLDAATALLEAHPGGELSLRAVCAQVGVRMPTLYHYYGSKQGLIDAVVERGFAGYLAMKQRLGTSGDPIDDIRSGWDQHIEWALANPAIYALMWKAVPGSPTPAADHALEALRAQTGRASAQGLLAVSPEDAADEVLAACVGTALFLITARNAKPDLSPRIREATLASITGAAWSPPDARGSDAQGGADGDSDSDADARPGADPHPSPRSLALALAAALQETPTTALAPEEQALLLRWLATLGGR